MEKPTKKLALSKETLRSLNDDELVDVVGGDKSVVCVDTVICQSGVCNSGAVCHSGICQSGAVCQSAVGC
jgi:hypothetical protein